MEPLGATLSLLMEWKQPFAGMKEGTKVFGVPRNEWD